MASDVKSSTKKSRIHLNARPITKDAAITNSKTIFPLTTTTTATIIPTKNVVNQKRMNAFVATATATAATTITVPVKKSLSSMSDEEIIQENLKELLDKSSREERKANGRIVAVIVAFMVIFLAAYHAWIRKTAALAGVLVPVVIMLSYGAWVVILAKRDKHKRALFERHLEEVQAKNKFELGEKARLKHFGKYDQTTTSQNIQPAAVVLHFENEICPHVTDVATTIDENVNSSNSNDSAKKKKQLRYKQRNADNRLGIGEVTVHCTGLGRRPSLREKLFGPKMKFLELQTNIVGAANGTDTNSISVTNLTLQQKRERLRRMNTLPMPHVTRMSSAP